MSQNRYHTELLRRVRAREAKVAVVGLGRVGLPLSVTISESGFTVVGLDVANDIITAINRCTAPVSGVEPARVRERLSRGQFCATEQTALLDGADIAIITVQTPIDENRRPDLSAVRCASQTLAQHVQPGTLIVLESTTYPGTTEEIVAATFQAQGFRPGKDIFIAYSPERLDLGNDIWGIKNTPKVVAGLTASCLEAAMAFYGTFVQTLVPVSDLRTAEITKLYENIFRVVNIALANEFQMVCDAFGIDVWEALRACATKPFGFMPFEPGPGVGGHCLPVHPFYLAYKARDCNVRTSLTELAGRINEEMPTYILRKILSVLTVRRQSLSAARIGLIGVAYKRNTDDVRGSPAVRLIELLEAESAIISYHDPHVPALDAAGHRYQSHAMAPEFLSDQDCIVILTDHDGVDWSLVLRYAPAILDTRNVISPLSKREPAVASERGGGAPSRPRRSRRGYVSEAGKRSGFVAEYPPGSTEVGLEETGRNQGEYVHLRKA